MNVFQSPSSDPYFNLALEEHLFNRDEDFILIYINTDSVICGKHQNAVAETNGQFLYENKVPLIRRFSGGGTVYHDLGNINFSFIQNGEEGKVIDFMRYATEIKSFLRSIRIKAEITDRNDLVIDGYKITGHAAHAKNKRALHHGTLLFDSNLQRLSAGLKSNREKFKSRAVQSVRSPVTNISQYLKDRMDINEFTEMLMDHLCKSFDTIGHYQLTDVDKAAIDSLIKEKYTSFEWNVGYGPDYSFKIDASLKEGRVSLEVEVSKGLIKSVVIGEKTIFENSWQQLIGKRHSWRELSLVISNIVGRENEPLILNEFF